ncbi:MAG: hypothetical protein R2752_11060 [Vicinamibacterales bacterium]
MPRRFAGLALVAVLLGVLVALGLVARLLVETGRELTLPAPTGPYAVGRTSQTWTDDGATDEFAAAPGTPRELVAWLWYPAVPASGPPADYLPRAWRQAFADATTFPLAKLVTLDPSRVRAHAMRDAALSSSRPTWPIVLLRAGSSALTTEYTTLAEDLASHGYVVVGIDAPFRTFAVVLPDGRSVARLPANDPEAVTGDAQVALATRLMQGWVRDLRFTVDRLAHLNAAGAGPFAGHLDLDAIGVVGHSLGGATAAQFCHDDGRCRAGVDLDGRPFGTVVTEGLRQPFLVLLSDHGSTDATESGILADLRAIERHQAPGAAGGLLMIRGANHFSFGDQILRRSPMAMGLLRATGVLPLEPRRGLAVAAGYVRRFLDVQLKRADPGVLQAARGEYPEVIALPGLAGGG